MLLGVAAVLALIVGLSVGLSRGGKSDGGPAPRFNVSLATVSPQTLQTTYASCEELRSDLMQASGYLANAIIDANALWYFHKDNSYFFTRGGEGGVIGRPVVETAADASSNKLPQSSTPSAITEDSFGTNNQVEGFEEADVVQSDGTRVYAAYGLEIAVLQADNATLIDRIELPAAPSDCYSNKISSLLLVSQRLVVITSGWCNSGESYCQVIRERAICVYLSMIPLQLLQACSWYSNPLCKATTFLLEPLTTMYTLLPPRGSIQTGMPLLNIWTLTTKTSMLDQP
jgi:hypothetical protein